MTLAALRPDVNLKYAYFLIKFVGLNHLKDGTSNPTLSRDAFGAQALPLPPLAEQRAIAHILGTLDDKIELNRRMNETLEAMARALFKSWFVDFDPVRAKAEGRDPGLPKPLADLFPDSLRGLRAGRDSGGVGGRAARRTVLVLADGRLRSPCDRRTHCGSISGYRSERARSDAHTELMVQGPGSSSGRSGCLESVLHLHDDFLAI